MKKNRIEELTAMYTDEITDAMNGEYSDEAITVMVAALVALDCTSEEEVLNALYINEVEVEE
jgi:predicted Zn-dependent protease